LRQAYDYWQDQPGNYYPIITKVLIPSRELSLGWSSSQFPSQVRPQRQDSFPPLF
jgi:hypothetical protein